VKRVLVTGMSGTGKSSVIAALAARGYKAIDTDYGGWAEVVSVVDEQARSGLVGNRDQLWREDRIAELLATDDAEVLFVGGAAPNQSKFYGRFDHVVLLSAPAPVMMERLVSRTNNPYGKDPEELARALALKERVEPMLRRAADLEIDTSIPLDQVVARILDLVAEGSGRAR
jgi:dephospho-CoA kinase